MIEFDQEVGRGGRGGEVVRSKVLLKESTFRKHLFDESQRMEPNEAGMNEFVVSLGCRRMVMSRFMDGAEEEHTCDDINGEVCDRCAGIMSDKEIEMRNLTEVPQVKEFEKG